MSRHRDDIIVNIISPRTKIQDNYWIRPVTLWPYMRLCTVSKLHVRQFGPKIVIREKQDGGQRSCCYWIFWQSICAGTVWWLERTFMIFYNLRFTCRTSYYDFHTSVNDVIMWRRAWRDITFSRQTHYIGSASPSIDFKTRHIAMYGLELTKYVIFSL